MHSYQLALICLAVLLVSSDVIVRHVTAGRLNDVTAYADVVTDDSDWSPSLFSDDFGESMEIARPSGRRPNKYQARIRQRSKRSGIQNSNELKL